MAFGLLSPMRSKVAARYIDWCNLRGGGECEVNVCLDVLGCPNYIEKSNSIIKSIDINRYVLSHIIMYVRIRDESGCGQVFATDACHYRKLLIVNQSRYLDLHLTSPTADKRNLFFFFSSLML